MAFNQNFSSPAMHMEKGSAPLKQQQSSVSTSAATSENVNGCFDCNICLDSSNEPVVTLCGHLYCWPCIYKWLQVQRTSLDFDGQSKCPVCKAYISTSSLVPLYGRGTSSSEFEVRKPQQLDLAIPHRPPALGMDSLLDAPTYDLNQQSHPNPFPQHHRMFHLRQHFSHPFSNYTSVTPTFGGVTTTNFFSPTINMVSEMVFARIFGRADTGMFAHPYSNSYPVTGNGSPRLRRHEMQLDKSLNRVSIFLFCCIVLCLILF